MRLHIDDQNEFSRPGASHGGLGGAHYKPDFVPGIRRERLNQMAGNDYEGKFTHATIKRPNLLVVGGVLYILYELVIK